MSCTQKNYPNNQLARSMKIKFLIFSCFLVISVAKTYGQGVLKFTKDTHDFGTIVEGKVASYDFQFKNEGNAPIIISNVAASCGCTTPYWTHEPVLPGKTGKITASYNSAGRPGPFTKTITVTSNATEASLILTINGNVNPKPTATAAELAKSPVFALQTTGHNFGKVEKGQSVLKTFAFTNTGKSDLVIKAVSSACACVTYKISKPTVKPGEQATLELRYAPRALSQQAERVIISTNDLNNPSHTVILQADVVESLTQQSVLREQKTTIPFK